MKVIATTYRMTMSDGTPYAVRADSAGHAIEMALREYRGRKVVLCYSGVTEEDAIALRKADPEVTPYVGTVQHEIPFHDAIDPEVKLPPITPRPARFPDPGTAAMFSEFP